MGLREGEGSKTRRRNIMIDKIISKVTCFVTGHKWSQWQNTRVGFDIAYWRERGCNRCLKIECSKADDDQSKVHNGL